MRSLLLVLVATAMLSPPRVSTAPTSARFLLPVRATIDGSNRLVISAAGARWQHGTGTPVTEVAIGDQRWRPDQQPVLANRGATAFLPADVDVASARLRVREGRDLVGLEIDDGIATVFVADTPPGAAEYAFDLSFARRDVPCEITIRARIDGSDELRIDATGMQWRHRHWEPPTDVRIDDEPWCVGDGPTRRATRLPADVDFRTARVVARGGRDTVCLRIADDHVLVLFADDPPGAADYWITLRFG